MTARRWLVFMVLFEALVMHAGARAQEAYPTRPIRMVLPGPPGNITDTMARVISKTVGDAVGVPMVVENRPGGGGIIATEMVVRAKPDGYTVLMISAPLVTNPGLHDSLPYDALRDLAPVVLLSENGFVITVSEKQPYRNFQQLIDAARRPDSRINYASPGIGTVAHLAGQLLNAEYGTHFVSVAYKGSAQAFQDVAAGHVPMSIDSIPPGLGLIRQGRLRALAVSHAVRQKELPDVPTLKELGYPKIDAKSFSGFMVPAGTPREIVVKLNAAFNNAIAHPEVRKALAGQNLVGGTPEEFGAMLKAETDRWVPLIRRLGIRAE